MASPPPDISTPTSAEPSSPTTSRGAGRGARGNRRRGRGWRGRGRGGGAGGGGGPRIVRQEDLEDGDARLKEGSGPSAVVPVPITTETKSDNIATPTMDAPTTPATPSTEAKQRPPRKQPAAQYVNPDRINTGGLKTERLSDAELAKVMERMRLNNEQLIARRELVEDDEAEFKATVAEEAERQQAQHKAQHSRNSANREARAALHAAHAAKSEAERKVQGRIDSTRAEAAERKLAKQSVREWDMEKMDQFVKGPKQPTGGKTRPEASGSGGGSGGQVAPPTAAAAAEAPAAEASAE